MIKILIFFLSFTAFAQTQTEIDNEKSSDLTRLSALKNFSTWINDFKTAYPQFSSNDEGFIRKHVYDTHGTEAIMAKMEELEGIELTKITELDAIEKRLKNISFGIEVIAYFAYLTTGATMTQEQVLSYSQVKTLLETGALAQARGFINAMATDEVFITPEIKTKILAKLDAYIPTM